MTGGSAPKPCNPASLSRENLASSLLLAPTTSRLPCSISVPVPLPLDSLCSGCSFRGALYYSSSLASLINQSCGRSDPRERDGEAVVVQGGVGSGHLHGADRAVHDGADAAHQGGRRRRALRLRPPHLPLLPRHRAGHPARHHLREVRTPYHSTRIIEYSEKFYANYSVSHASSLRVRLLCIFAS